MVLLVVRQPADDHGVQHEADGPDVNLGRGLGLALEKLWGHVLQTATVDVFHPKAGNGAEDSKVHNPEVYARHVKLSLVVVQRRLREHHVLKLEVAMDDLARVTVVDGIQNLGKHVEGVSLVEDTAWLLAPELVELPSFEVFHNNYKLLFLRQREVVVKFDNVFVAQLAKRRDLLLNQFEIARA